MAGSCKTTVISQTVFSPSTLQGKVAVVTGAARGIGRAIALALAYAGADVAGIDLCGVVDPRSGVMPSAPEDLAETARLVEAAGRRWHSVIADQRRLPAMRRAAAEIESSLGPVAILAANAGIQQFHPLRRRKASTALITARPIPPRSGD